MSALALSVLLALVSAVAYAVGAILQERVAATDRNHLYAPLRHPAWWVAMVLNGVGALLHVGALVYGPLSLVQPMGALTIVFALPIAAVFVHRRTGALAWRGALMATVGLAGLLSLTAKADSASLADGEELVVAGASLGTVVVLFAVARWVRRPVVRSMVLAGAAGVAFGIASVFIKSLAVGWSSHGLSGQWEAVPAVLVCATAGVLLSQASYRDAGLTAPLATVTVVNPAVASAVGLTLFGESFRYGPTGAALALAAGLLAAAGLILLTTNHAQTEQARLEQAAAQEAEGARGTRAPQALQAAEEPSEGLLPSVPVQQQPVRPKPAGRRQGGPSGQTVTPPALR
ncbi:DMT family transporter [Streptomyces sp. NPDC021093]|uniref:DMT family transporter n=1 Tax=Streptomyces sp. NPDC021093 TaxID=3365112 RepID=UPI0037A94269